MASLFLQHLSRRVLVCDGGMGTQIHKVPLSVETDYCGCENCTDILVATRPDVIQKIHEDYLAAGADCVETDSFGSNTLVLGEFDIAERAFELSKKAGEVARAAADKHSTSDRPRFVLGSMGPGTKLITLGNTNWQAMFESYREQARGLLAGGVDAFIIETCQDLLQIKCAVNAVLAALEEKGRSPFDTPILVSVTIETTGTMLLGSSIEAAACALAQYPIASLGLNCATGPTEMSEHVHFLGKHWGQMGSHAGRIPGLHHRAVSVMPNAGLPVLVEGRTEYPLRPQPFVEAMLKFIEQDGVNLVGGCCGTTPDHIRLLADAVKDRRAAQVSRSVFPVGVTSLYSTTEYRQDNSFLIVGERMNASGSRAFKKLLEQEDWDGIVSLAKEQLREGAHVLDLNVDYAGRDNARDMSEIVRRVVRQVDAPLMVDSTQLATIEAGLKHSGGKCIINSANFEDGPEKFDAVMKLARTYGAAVVIGSIDEDKQASMARTADRKFAIAARAYERAVIHWGLDPADLLFDPLVLPISTGMESDRRSALELVEGVRRIAEKFPECQTVVGLSNASFGLSPPARLVLNSALLHELREAGLTAAIVHAGKILPRNKISDEQWNAAVDLIYDRRREGFDPLQAYIDLFKDVQASAASTRKDKSSLTVEQRLRDHIIDGEKQGLKETIEEALARYKPLDIINDHLLDGMKTVGELFGSGRMQLPFVLQSAEVMKMAVAQLEPLMERAAGQSKGTIVLATVKGDVHDIGKNLVDIILTNNGYKVINLGIKQPLHAMVEAWKEHKADAIGMSGLLVKSVNVMEENIKELNAAGTVPPLLLGGAALTRHYCESHLRSTYQGSCFYGKDAFDGLRTMDMIMAGRSDELEAEIESRQQKRTAAEETIAASRVKRAADAETRQQASVAPGERVRSDVSVSVPVPPAPFLGSRVVDGISLDEVFQFINPIALFRGQWQFKKGALSDDEYERVVEDEVRPVFERVKTVCREKKLLVPQVAYGYFECNSDGDDLIIWEPANGAADGRPDGLPVERRELERFRFPRQPDKQRLCISDFFRPVESGEVDVIGMHCVTVGGRIAEYARELFAANNYTEYLYFHGIGVETAEALAELWHKRMRQELGIATEDSPRIKELFTQHYRGSRYSFGYPACPDLSDQEKLFRLLRPERIGCTLTENWQIDPEQSTSAIIVHHPQAKYFNA
ncbi:MAG: 5-methyltetrahydrofolate--homocysteine methyltransferase [Phycisphaerae bacterium]